MDSGAISDLYQRYKTGTKRIVQWLADTARKSSSQRGRPPNTKLSPSDLASLSQQIAASADPKQSPPEGIDSIIIILKDVISGRREYAVWHARRRTHSCEASENQDASHSHFVEVLKRILCDLKLALSKSSAAKRSNKQAPTAASRQPRVNPSEQTVLRSPQAINGSLATPDDTSPIAAEDAHAALQSLPVSPPAEYELESQEDDAAFAIWCFFNDCLSIRIFLRAMWTSYRSGAINLEIAAFVTNQAFSIISDAAADMLADIPGLKTFDDVADLLGIEVRTHEGKVQDVQYKGISRATTFSNETEDPAELLCIPALASLVLMRKCAAVHATSWDRSIDAMHHACAIHGFTRSTISICDHIYKLMCNPERVRTLGGLDIFTGELAQFISSWRLSLQLVVHFQIYMEIHGIIENVTWHQGLFLVRVFSRIQQSLTTFTEQMPELRDHISYRNDIDDGLRSQLIDCITHGIQKPLLAGDKELLDNAFENMDDVYVSMLFMKSPVLCGMISYDMNSVKRSDGLKQCDNGRIVSALAHLYRTCRKAGMLKHDWPDMEFFIQVHGPKVVGLRDTPAKSPVLLSAAKQYGLAFGIELKEYGKKPRSLPISEQRVDLPSYNSIRRRQIGALAPIWHSGSSFTDDPRRSTKLGQHRGGLPKASLYTLAQEASAKSQSDLEMIMRDQRQTCQNYTPVQLLSVLKDSMIAAELSLHFDYHGFFLSCADMFDFMAIHCGERVGCLREARGHDPSFLIYEMVDEILWNAATREQGSMVGERRTGLLAEVAAYLDDHIISYGSEGIEHARALPSMLKLGDDFLESVAEIFEAAQPKQRNAGMSVSLQGTKVEMTRTELTELEEKERQIVEAKRAKNRLKKQKQKQRRKTTDQALAERGVTELTNNGNDGRSDH